MSNKVNIYIHIHIHIHIGGSELEICLCQASSMFAPASAQLRDTLQTHEGGTVLDSGLEVKRDVQSILKLH